MALVKASLRGAAIGPIARHRGPGWEPNTLRQCKRQMQPPKVAQLKGIPRTSKAWMGQLQEGDPLGMGEYPSLQSRMRAWSETFWAPPLGMAGGESQGSETSQ